jgi:hypothetical protein
MKLRLPCWHVGNISPVQRADSNKRYCMKGPDFKDAVIDSAELP